MLIKTKLRREEIESLRVIQRYRSTSYKRGQKQIHVSVLFRRLTKRHLEFSFERNFSSFFSQLKMERIHLLLMSIVLISTFSKCHTSTTSRTSRTSQTSAGPISLTDFIGAKKVLICNIFSPVADPIKLFFFAT